MAPSVTDRAVLTSRSYSRWYWLIIAAASLVPALLSALSLFLNSRFIRGRTEWNEIAFSFIDWLFLGFLTPFVYVLARRFPIRRGAMGRAIAAHLTGAVLLFITWASLGVLLADLLGRRPPQQPFLIYYLFWLMVSMPWSIFLYLLLLGSISAFTYYREARERESQQARLSAQLAEARLGALRMQLNPHFLFNSLNAITVLVRDQKTREASRMLELLSGILRQVLQSERQHEIPLDQELQFIEQYLAIEQVRFPDRLQIVWSIQPAVGAVLVPEFILQPLVENAVHHGVAKLSDAGTVEITAGESEGCLVLTVRDNGPGYYPTTAAGVGLRNTRARLETLFGTDAELEVRNVEGGGTIATVRLPLRRETNG